MVYTLWYYYYHVLLIKLRIEENMRYILQGYKGKIIYIDNHSKNEDRIPITYVQCMGDVTKDYEDMNVIRVWSRRIDHIMMRSSHSDPIVLSINYWASWFEVILVVSDKIQYIPVEGLMKSYSVLYCISSHLKLNFVPYKVIIVYLSNC